MTGATSTVGAGGAGAEAALLPQPLLAAAASRVASTKPSRFEVLRFLRTFTCLSVMLSISISFPLRSLMVALVVPFSEFVFGLQPVVQVATVNPAMLNVDLERAPADFFRSGCVLNWLFPRARTMHACPSFC